MFASSQGDGSFVRLVRYESNAESYANGDVVILNLDYPEQGLAIGADFSGLDDEYYREAVETKELGGGKYELKYRISAENSVARGRHKVLVSATNASGEVATTPIDLVLLSAPLIPIVVEGAVFSPGAWSPQLTASSSLPPPATVSGIWVHRPFLAKTSEQSAPFCGVSSLA